MAAPACLTCTKDTELALAVTIGSQEDVQGALAKHFWFSDHEYQNGILCQYCCKQIRDFHQFYCEIDQLHSQRRHDVASHFCEVKQELNTDDAADDESFKVKMEMEVNFEDDGDFEEGNDPEQEAAFEHDMGEEELEAQTKSVSDFIAENIEYDCNTCSEKHQTFADLQNHSFLHHEKRAYVLCCGNKYYQKSKLTAHIQFHVNPSLLQCDVCGKQLRTRRAFINHKETAHASADEKVFQCPMCPKKFSRQKHLNAHEKYHIRIKEKKWYCASCDQYFAYESILRNHNRAIHAADDVPKIKPDDATGDQMPEDDIAEDVSDKEAEDEGPNSLQKAENHQLKRWKRLSDNELIAKNISLECNTCAQKFESFQNLQKHSLTEHKKRAAVFCCGNKFTLKPSLIDHIRFHVDPTQLRCDICAKQFKQFRALRNHKESAHATEDQKVMQCSVCPKKFSSLKHLKLHEKYHMKLSEKKWHCETCDQYFAYESVLRQHHKSVHSKDSLYVCHVCAKEYHILSSYTSHVATHQESAESKQKPPEERLQCTECGSWVLKKGLRKHMLRHSGSETCEQCGQECKSKMALRYHMAQHRNGNFACTLCDKTFKQQLTLKEHMASHTGEVLYSCDFCQKTFNSHANRSAHRKKMHPKEWLEDKMKKNAATKADQMNDYSNAFSFL